MNAWLYAKCRAHIDPDVPEDEPIAAAEIEVSDNYGSNPTAPQGNAGTSR